MISLPRRPALALGIVASLAMAGALSGCGNSDKAGDSVSAESVEIPAEQALSGVDTPPVADPSATATPTTTEGIAANAGAAAADVAAAAGEAPAPGATPAKPAQ